SFWARERRLDNLISMRLLSRRCLRVSVPAEKQAADLTPQLTASPSDPEAIYDPAIWDTPGFALVLSWLAQKWHQRCHKVAPRGSKNPQECLTREQLKACLDSAAAELVREITQGRSLN